MLSFKSYLLINEAAAEGIASAKHQEHPEDNAIKSPLGFEHALSTLSTIHNGLKSGDLGDTHISTKLDGAPAVVFGRHPRTGKFFVATKHSAYGKVPKLATSHDEVDQYFGHSPGLAQKMHSALEHLPKVTPETGVYQGDFMHDSGERYKDGNKIVFKPNTLKYHIPTNTPEGKAAINSKIGFAVHTQIDGDPDRPETLQASPLRDQSVFRPHRDVHLVSPEIRLGNGNHIGKRDSDKVFNHLDLAQQVHDSLSDDHHDIVNQHDDHFSTYINQTVRTGEKPSTQGLRKHIETRMQKDVDKLKSEKGKAAATERMNAALAHHDAYEDNFSKALQIHHHVQSAKNILVSALNKAQKTENPMTQSIDGTETDPEGYVVQHRDNIVKLVDRGEFSRANFNKPKEWKK